MLSPIYRRGLHLTNCIILSSFFFAFEARCPLYSTVYYVYSMFKFLLYYYDILLRRGHLERKSAMNPWSSLAVLRVVAVAVPTRRKAW